MDEIMKERIRLKRENGILLDSDEIDAIVELNADFFERKKQEALDYFNKYGGIERVAKAHEEWLKSGKISK